MVPISAALPLLCSAQAMVEVEVGHQLGVGLLGDDGGDLGAVGGLREVADTGVDLGCDREVAELGEAAANVLNVVIDAEDLLVDQDDREVGALGGAGIVGGKLAVLHRDLRRAGVEAGGVGVDHLGVDHGGGEREAGHQGGHHKASAGERCAAKVDEFRQVVHGGGSSPGCDRPRVGEVVEFGNGGWHRVMCRRCPVSGAASGLEAAWVQW